MAEIVSSRSPVCSQMAWAAPGRQVRSIVSAKVGQVQTVLGLVDAQAIGPCLMHEVLIAFPTKE